MNDKTKDLDGSVWVQDEDKRGWTKHEAPPVSPRPFLRHLYQMEDDKQEIEIQCPRVQWPKDNPFLKIRLQPTKLNLPDDIDNPICKLTERIYTSIVKKEDEGIVEAILKYVQVHGYTELILIDEAFVREIIEKQIPKKVTMLGGELICPRCMCGYGRLASRSHLARSVHHCKWCGQVLEWGVIPYED